MTLGQKVGHKTRNGRHVSRPVGHSDHRKRPSYSRASRIAKLRVALALAPTIAEGLSELTVANTLRPATGEITASAIAPPINAPALLTAGGRPSNRR